MSSQTTLPTFMDHLRELQGRLFAVVFTFLVVAVAAYPFFDRIAGVIIAPLKEGQELVYLTPGGAFGFIIMVCAYVGIIGALPMIIYHLYRFMMPAVRKVHMRIALLYTIVSLFLALCGIIFAYFVMLPASLYFLTSFNLNHINPMLTIDSYFSFVMTYILAGALLFQLPIVMLIINSIKPLTPRRLMHYQGHLLVGSFTVAAVISPTPDVLNQTLLAAPVVVMYQFGIVVIWLKNRKVKKRQLKAAEAPEVLVQQEAAAVVRTTQASHPGVSLASSNPIPVQEPITRLSPVVHVSVSASAIPTQRPARPVRRSIDGMSRSSAVGLRLPVRQPTPTPAPIAPRTLHTMTAQARQLTLTRPARSLDGVSVLYHA